MIPAYLALGAPFLAAVVGLLGGRTWPRLVVPVAVAGASVAFLSALLLAGRSLAGDLYESARLADVPTGGPPIGVDLRVDGLAAVVSVAVCAVALAVQVYSIGYLKGDPRYSSYAALVSLFTAAMLLVVFADDLMVLLVGWEVMGVCSYFLIGHHWEQEGSRASAVKAFVTTRLGDVGFLFGIFLVGTTVGSFSMDAAVTTAAVENGRVDLPGTLSTDVWSGHTATIATLLLLCGVVGKSAQFPLHTWLPDAMAGPTPISALIHAATMVAAGIYLVARLFDVFLLAPATLAVMAVIACITMLGGAMAALGQDDIKRVLAYSTVSQLAYMLAALSVGSAVAAEFHLLTHAAFKALLFLAAGAVIHAVGTNLMPDMGGLRRLMPVTFLTMTLGLAALAGVPPLAGFFSKEAVLGAAEETAVHHEGPAYAWTGWLVLVVGLLTVAVTAAYVARLWLMTFFDRPRSPVAAHESSPVMRWPLVLLAVPTVLLGLVGLRDEWLPDWAATTVSALGSTPSLVTEQPDIAQETLHVGPVTSALSVALAVIGAFAVWLVWRRAPAADPTAQLRQRRAFEHAFFVDDFYDRAFVQPVRVATRAVGWADDAVVGEAVRDTGQGTGRLSEWVSRAQGSTVQAYLTGLLAGVLLLVAGVVTFAS
ncbi:MAG TPA: NADH-quinone oxidoreductase subunit L [Actinomycetes bacterium]|nr:NADH-quinone oxidoreductase subunit L [Actinomycetes bacterium]